MIDELAERLGVTDIPSIVEDFVPEAGVEQMQHRMLRTADVEIDGHPCRFLFAIDEGVRGFGADESQVVPAGSCPLGHGVGFATISLAVEFDDQP